MILLKNGREISFLREANRIVTEVLKIVVNHIQPGITTRELDRIAEKEIRKRGARPAFKGYRGYPFTTCISVNEVVVHGIPGGRKIKEGDLVSIDLGAKWKGYYGDAALTYPVGKISPRAKKLLQVTYTALWEGIRKAKAGNRLGDISFAIQNKVEREGFQVVKAFVGHGIGRELHEDPQVPNFGEPGKGVKLREGMTLAIEPMVNEGTEEVIILEDGWTAVTRDGKLSAHFEHTVVIKKEGPEILTLGWEDLLPPFF